MNNEHGFDINIRQLLYDDCVDISLAFATQNWNKPVERFERYLQESSTGKRTVFVAEVKGEFAGYVTVDWRPNYPMFKERSIPEIADLNVLIRFQKQGVGTGLLNAAEELISKCSSVAGILVGLDADYGNAQRLYVERGYVPDGLGISQHGRFPKYGDTIFVDNDLTLGFTKSLK